MSWPPEVLETPRLRLRRPHIHDAGELFASLSGDAEVTRYLGWQTHAFLEETRRQLVYEQHRWNRGAAWTWVIEIGQQAAGLIQLEPHAHRWTLGFSLQRKAWGEGYVREAATAILEHAFRHPLLYRVEAVCDVDNTASARLLQRIGLRHEGRLQRYAIHPNVSPEPRDVDLFAITRADGNPASRKA